MGLTIHYTLKHLRCDALTARSIVQQLHEHARTLGFAQMTEVFHETAESEHEDTFGAVYPGRRFMQTGREPSKEWQQEEPEPFVPMTDDEIEAAADEVIEAWEEKNQRREMGLPDEDEDDECSFGAELINASEGSWLDVQPLESWFFWASDEGAEPLLIGLARYPAMIEHEVNGTPDQFETGLGVGWHWQGFCKTQYAAMPQYGGEDHFIAAHRRVIGVLDKAGEIGIDVEVLDEGEYWQQRDEAALRAEVRRWNAITAGVVGKLKDEFDKDEREYRAPILDHPDFEGLEFEGRKWLDQMGGNQEADAAE